MKFWISYILIRAVTFPIRWLSYSWIHRIGKGLGRLAFYLHTDYRKRTLSNLALAKSLELSNEQILEIAKQSFENLAINCLEYAKLESDKNLQETVECINADVVDALHKSGQGIIFFCAHQANWEILFIYGTTHMNGMAIGKEIKNKRLYNWIVSIREKNGGKIISAKNAIREGMRALRNGHFLGIVGDQGFPESTYRFPFLGRSAGTSTAPALLAYKTNCPIIFTSIKRTQAKYQMRYFDPIWPDLNQPLEKEVPRMMDQVLKQLQESIEQEPSQWLWQHNRWKQQTREKIRQEFRYDSIALILPENPKEFEKVNEHLLTLKNIYPTEFLCIYTHKNNTPSIEADEIIYYTGLQEVLCEDYRCKLIFNFTENKKIKKHYLNLSAFKVLSLKDLKNRSKPYTDDLTALFTTVLCKYTRST